TSPRVPRRPSRRGAWASRPIRRRATRVSGLVAPSRRSRRPNRLRPRLARAWRMLPAQGHAALQRGGHKVDDVESRKKAIESHRAEHLKAGLHFEEVWSNVDSPKEIFFTFEVDDLARARAFLQESGALDKDRLKRGEIPELF